MDVAETFDRYPVTTESFGQVLHGPLELEGFTRQPITVRDRDF